MGDYFKHPMALVESDDIGDGTRIWAFAHVMIGARIGANCNIGDHCFVEGQARIGDDVTIKNYVAIWDGVTVENGAFIGPGVTMTNDLRPRSRTPNWVCSETLIGQGVTVGANATLLCGITIGSFAFIGAGAVVTKDVPSYALAYGNPARVTGYVCRCSAPLDFGGSESLCPKCGRMYLKGETGVSLQDQNDRRRDNGDAEASWLR